MDGVSFEVRIGENGGPRRPSSRGQVGLAPQSLALYDELTAEENVAFFGRPYDLTARILRIRRNSRSAAV